MTPWGTRAHRGSRATRRTTRRERAVTLSGGSWAAGESVHINVNDDHGQSWARDVDVTADADGKITDSFTLPDWFIATYFVRATGASGTATATFTDGNVKWDTSTPADVTETLYTAQTNCTGAIKTPQYPNTAKSSGTVGVGSSESVRLDAEAVADNGGAFLAWSSIDSPASAFTVIPGTGGRSICIAGFQSGNKELPGHVCRSCLEHRPDGKRRLGLDQRGHARSDHALGLGCAAV